MPRYRSDDKLARSTSRRRSADSSGEVNNKHQREANSTARRRARQSSGALDVSGTIGDGFRYVAHQRGSPSYDEYVAIAKNSVDFCKGGVRASYVRGPVMDNADIMLIAYDERELRGVGRKRKVPLGFAALRLRGKYVLTIDVVCSRGHGRKILQAVEETACRIGRRHVVLYAMPQVINFYRRAGYRHAFVGQQEAHEVTRLAESALKSRARTIDGAMSDARLRKLMYKLAAKKLVYNKGCVGIDVLDVTSDEYDKSCGTDGYYMRKGV